MSKLDDTISRLKEWFERYDKPVVMSSFGKDSMVMLHIILRMVKKRVPVIYHAVPWEPWKNDFAWGMMKLWKLETYDYPPVMSGIKVKEDMLEIVHRYQIGTKFGNGIDIPVNVIPPESTLRFGHCGKAIIERPKGTIKYPWNLILIGHKSSDVDPFDGHIPLMCDTISLDELPTTAFPLREWDDKDVWDFIEEHHVPVQVGTRYIDRKEVDYKGFNNDYIEACTNCIDPRKPEKVYCPLVDNWIDNISKSVTKFEGMASYIGT